MAEPGQKRTSTIQALLILLFIAIIIYFITRVVFIYYATYGRLEKILAILFFLSEAFVMMHAFGYFTGVYRLNRKKSDILTATGSSELKDFPSVAVLIPARHEPRGVLANTLTSCLNLAYPNKTVYLLDDSIEEEYKKESDGLVQKYKTGLFRRTKPWHGAKAGIINDCLETLKEKYVAVFDADQNPTPDFLSVLLPILEKNPKLAFIQTPQFYSNLQTNKIAFGSNMQQSIFYEYVCEGKSTSQAMICCGTNVVFRREILLDVGGLDESTVTEDFATSFKMHLKGWESLYYNHVHTFGMGPEDLASFFKQQNRWAIGNVGVFRMVIKKFFQNPLSLKPVQWFEYLITGSYYFIGWAYFFLILCPITYIFFNVPSFFMNPVVYTLTFMPYLILSLSIFYTSMLGRYYKVKQIVMGQLLMFIALPIYLRASLSGLVGIKGKFQVTAKSGSHRISYFKLWPQLSIWSISLVAMAWGLNRFMYERTASSMINVGWISYHFLFLSGIFYFNEEEIPKIYRKKLLKKVGFEYKIVERRTEQLGLERQPWGIYFSVFLSERLEPGTIIMCKVKPSEKDSIIFDGKVAWSNERRFLRGYETSIVALTIPDKDKEELKKVIHK